MAGPNFNRKALSTEAYVKASKLRASLDISDQETVCPIDIALHLGMDVRFDSKGLEGLYLNTEIPQIILMGERPSGRIHFSCGHELGHHAFGHGHKADMLIEEDPAKNLNIPEEFLADCFSGALLMPATLVQMLFHQRGVHPKTASPQDFYIIAGVLGVGYRTLISHMTFMLRTLDVNRRLELLKHQPKKIRQGLIQEDTNGELLVVDGFWKGRGIDLRKGDWLLTPPSFEIEGNVVQFVREQGSNHLYQAIKSGTAQVSDRESEWVYDIRVSKQPFLGYAEFRHLEDDEEDALGQDEEGVQLYDLSV